MKIDAFSLNLSSSRRYSRKQTREVTHEFSFANVMDGRMAEFFSLVDENGNIIQAYDPTTNRASPWYDPVSMDGREGFQLTQQFFVEMEKMRRVMSTIMDHFQSMMSQGCSCHLNQIQQIYAMPVNQNDFSQFRFWEHTQTQKFTYEEREHLKVSANGMVRTQDNREIDFSFELGMDRSFLQEDVVEYTASGYALVDPLIIRLDTDAPLLSGGQFSFDLDQDGSQESLTMPGAGYGFLALDLNQDGEINDGSELFGPSSGNGFAELAEYDLDGNLWIDENDAIFNDLSLWEEDGEGGMTLTQIKDAGIGAIYLAGIRSGFDLKSEENELEGRIKRTSIALTEEGDVLPVQEMEYTV